jgi:hypothetical protein
MDQKCKIINAACKALPFVLPELGADAANLVISQSARRDHPLLRELRGRSYDHFPPVYFPTGQNDASALFCRPELGYVSRYHSYNVYSY